MFRHIALVAALLLPRTDDSFAQYEVRYYAAKQSQFWTNAHIASENFEAAQNDGFYKNFDYISGQNSAKEEIPMTAPVIFRKNETGGWQVSFFTPSKYQTLEEVPVPTNPDVTIAEVSQVHWAVLVFGGFATEADYRNAEKKLLGLLKQDGLEVVEGSEWSRVWAGYDSPFVLFNRHNEVLIQVKV